MQWSFKFQSQPHKNKVAVALQLITATVTLPYERVHMNNTTSTQRYFSHLYKGQPVIWFTSAESATLCFGLWQWQLDQPLMPIAQLRDVPLVGRVIANDFTNLRWQMVNTLYALGKREQLEAYIAQCWLVDGRPYQHAGNAGMSGTWDTVEGNTLADVGGN